ncbi:FadR/GntR family transcriptional regulator [Actinomyces sp.]|uniref:FadR/GntR family transcriptional regulator n=1 Tax=Actinomyces sp. TaxID=29317 RepID=UPI0026DD780D|nr:FadR/GntR family transcriptional regulator [Actinomyces sp.]MDO4899056.1 FadR/GntR family transcriptional regulator [Actinomyces sp.]
MTVAEMKRGAYASTSEATTQTASAMNSIKDYILQSHLQPGDPLPTESQLCETLGVSRSSVREAVRTLAALDIVEVRHGHGMFVGQVSMRPMVESLVFRGLLKPGDDYRSLREVVEVRRTLDSALAAEVVEAWRSREDTEIDAVVDEMEALAERGETFTDQDRGFHQKLLAPVPNQLFAHLMEAFWAIHTLTVPMLDAPRPEDIVKTANAHRAMLQAARAGDTEAYREAVVAHYEPLVNALTRS